MDNIVLNDEELNAIKQEIEQLLEVPISLLTGKNLESVTAQALELISYRESQKPEQKQPKTAAEQFADWLNGGKLTETEKANNILEEIVKRYTEDNSKEKSNTEQFADFMRSNFDY